MDVEELLDQLTEDADFYEYFERNMDWYGRDSKIQSKQIRSRYQK